MPKSVTTAAPRGEQDVVRLDVAVHDAARVRVGEGARDVAQDADDFGDRERSPVGQATPERFALDERHGEVRQPSASPAASSGTMLACCSDAASLDLALEPLER